ncbi:uncharacterized protein [Periplaneta americana]|uniref:uncharacterized protein isoform X4 n=2 Tax=Periplaneta americana TaxID=6978 RepID=UPI0037E795FB
MPYCFVPGCKSGYSRLSNTRHYFSPPKEKDGFGKWARAISRKDRQLSVNNRICDLHFSEDMIIKSDCFIIKGQKTEIPRVRWKLQPGAVPHIFHNLPKYVSTQVNPRKSATRQKNGEPSGKRRKKSTDIYDGDETITADRIEVKVVLDVIKMEHEVDPLAIPGSDSTVVEEEKPLSEALKLFNLHSTLIKPDCEDHNFDVTSEMKLDETPVPKNFPMVKCEIEEDSYDLDGVKNELKQEITPDESEEVFTERISSTCGDCKDARQAELERR